MRRNYLVYTVSTADLNSLIEAFRDSDELKNDAARKLSMHLTAVERFENREDAAKVAKHMESFLLILDQQLDADRISASAYDVLYSDATDMLAMWN
ncbi:FIMAH domain-containing protein [Oceanobacillus manasiensis]|uniref:FIMAH domain-containing protein n=1 Tax=Oceanobacillus manasiensis TaxID=586413 RepID=UPI0038CD5C6B